MFRRRKNVPSLLLRYDRIRHTLSIVNADPIEDLVITNGSNGGLHAVERMKHMVDNYDSIELKWDGMHVVYWGRDEKGVFRMIPKNAWAYLKSGKTQTSSGAPTIMNGPNDVYAFVMGTGNADPNDEGRVQFAKQFASMWPYFEKISPKQGYLEGGLLFYPGNKPDGQSAKLYRLHLYK